MNHVGIIYNQYNNKNNNNYQIGRDSKAEVNRFHQLLFSVRVLSNRLSLRLCPSDKICVI